MCSSGHPIAKSVHKLLAPSPSPAREVALFILFLLSPIANSLFEYQSHQLVYTPRGSMVSSGSVWAMQNAPAKTAAWTPRPSQQVKRSIPIRQQHRQLVAARLPVAASATWQQRGWQLVALCLASLQLVSKAQALLFAQATINPLALALLQCNRLLYADFLSSSSGVPQAVGLPALADTSSYTIERGPATAQEEEDEQYFITVPQDLDSAGTQRQLRRCSLWYFLLLSLGCAACGWA